MIREEKIAEAKRLRDEGMTFKEIAARLDVSVSGVWRWLNPERNREIERKRIAKKREWMHKNYKCVCVSCGVEIYKRGKKRNRKCVACFRSEATEDRRWRWEQIKVLWAEGLPLDRLARRLGLGRPSLDPTIDRLQHEFGEKLPPRRAGWKGHAKRPGPRPQVRLSLSKDQARERFAHAVRSGVLTRPQTCERCGGPGPIDGHHFDYSKPLEVEWLCIGCHKAEHRQALVA